MHRILSIFLALCVASYGQGSNQSVDLSTGKVIGILPASKGGSGVNNAGTLTHASNTTITGGGTLALGGFTLTAPATGTAALLGTNNVFTGTNTFTVPGDGGFAINYDGTLEGGAALKVNQTVVGENAGVFFQQAGVNTFEFIIKEGDLTLAGGVQCNDAVQAGEFIADNQGAISSREAAVNGFSATGFKAPVSLAGNIFYALPGADGSSGDVLSTNGNQVLSWITPSIAGSALTGTTLASNVVTSSLTSLGRLSEVKLADTSGFSIKLSSADGSLSSDRTVGITVNNANRSLTLNGSLVLGGDLVTSGANSVTLTTTGATNVTLPTAGTLATLAETETFTNKSIVATQLTGTIADARNTVSNATTTTMSALATITGAGAITGATTTDLTLSGGSTGATLVIGQGTNGGVTLNPKGTGFAAIVKPSQASIRETLLKLTTSDGGNDQLLLYNATSTNAVLVPGVFGYLDSANSAQSLALAGALTAANDASDSAAAGIVAVNAFRTDSASTPSNATFSAIANRKIFTVANNGTPVFTIYPTLANFASTITTLTLNSTIDSTTKDTGSLVTEGGIGVEKAVFIGTTLNVAGAQTLTGATIHGNVNRLKGYTVATLPAGTVGDTAYVTDALAPTFLATVVGGGAIVTPVFYNGTNWVGF